MTSTAEKSPVEKQQQNVVSLIDQQFCSNEVTQHFADLLLIAFNYNEEQIEQYLIDIKSSNEN